MRRLRQPNFGDVRHRYARLEAAAHPLVLGGLSCGQPFQRAFGATTQKTEIPCRNKDEPPAGGQGRSHRGKILVACAAEVKERALCRIRLNKIDDFSKASLHAFVEKTVAPGVAVKTDGWSGYAALEGRRHEAQTLGTMPAHIVLPWVHRVFSNLKRWALGVYHGLRKKHVQTYLDEFVFRFNRRKNRPAGFVTLIKNAAQIPGLTYKMLIAAEPTG